MEHVSVIEGIHKITFSTMKKVRLIFSVVDTLCLKELGFVRSSYGLWVIKHHKDEEKAN